MTSRPHIDGVLVQWGERMFYPANRIVSSHTPRLGATMRHKADHIRQRIEATVVRRAPQVMVKVARGGMGMQAIALHFRYISKDGRLEIEDDRGVTRTGMDALRDLTDQWRYGGSLIDEVSHRREAFYITLSMPSGTVAGTLLKAVREFAQAELAEHRYVMVLHEHQAHPHVHLSVRAESTSGNRLDPRKTDLHRWRATFAEKLRGWGIEAEASRQVSRGEIRNFDPLWRVKAREEGRLRKGDKASKSGPQQASNRAEAVKGWVHIMKALGESDSAEDRALAQRIAEFVRDTPFMRRLEGERGRDTRSDPIPLRQQSLPTGERTLDRDRSGPDVAR